MKTSFAGDFVSALKGSGLEFSQLRSYVPGDDVRSIDWKSSARHHKLMIKEFMQEKERTVILVLDRSLSLALQSQSSSKYQYAQYIATSIALIAEQSNDKVGLLVCGDAWNYFPPRKGAKYCAALVEAILTSMPSDTEVFTREAIVEKLMSHRLRNTVLCWISDWAAEISEKDQAVLHLLGKQHEALAIRVYEPLERYVPDVGLLSLGNIAGSGEQILIETSGQDGVELNALLHERAQNQKRALSSARFSVLDIGTDTSYIDALASFFYHRAH